MDTKNVSSDGDITVLQSRLLKANKEISDLKVGTIVLLIHIMFYLPLLINKFFKNVS